MMNAARSSAKYQVYFFLYLAVVCELLIIIVERDDAENALLAEQERLREMVQKVILQLANNIPVAVTSGSGMMRLGETRPIRFSVMGLGADRQITVQPVVRVLRDGVLVDSLRGGREIRVDVLRNEHGEQAFVFDFRPTRPGRYTFDGMTGSDFADLTMENTIRIGDFEVEREVFEALSGMSTETLLRKSQHIATSMSITVVSDSDPLGLFVDDAEGAAGNEMFVPVVVSGTDPARVTATANVGRVEKRGEGLVWVGSFSDAGEYPVTIHARDNRGEGAGSATVASFTARVRDAASGVVPGTVYVNETFRFSVAVAGMGQMGKYRWRILDGGREAASGEGPHVSYKPTNPGRLVVAATYDGKPYTIKGRGISEYGLTVLETPVHIEEATFASGGEYPITQKFELVIARYGRRKSEYCVPVQPRDISFEATDDAGRDLLDELDVRMLQSYTLLTFTLKGKVSREGTAARISVAAGGPRRDFDIVLYRDDAVMK